MKKFWKGFWLRGICLTSVAFVFQACYGGPQDFGFDLYVAGQVKAKSSGLPIEGIRVSNEYTRQYTYTDNEGRFAFYTLKLDDVKIHFEDADSIKNGLYLDKDTILSNMTDKVFLRIELEDRK